MGTSNTETLEQRVEALEATTASQAATIAQLQAAPAATTDAPARAFIKKLGAAIGDVYTGATDDAKAL